MPIYEYRCSACGHADEHLQKVSDAPLKVCPACGKAKYQKQLSAAGFQLKGTGWYATDFKGAGKKADSKKTETETKTEKKTETKPESKPESKPEKKSQGKSETKAAA